MPRFLLVLSLTLTPTLTAQAGTSNSLMDVSPDGSRLVVANTDSGSVSVVDVSSRKLIAEVPVGDKPEGVSWVGNGPLALVTLWGDDALIYLDTASGKVVQW